MLREDGNFKSIVRLSVMHNSRYGCLTNKIGAGIAPRDLKNHRFGLLSVNYVHGSDESFLAPKIVL